MIGAHHSDRSEPPVSPSNSNLSQTVKRRAADFSADLLGVLLRAGGTNTYRDVINALWERQPVFSEHDIHLFVPAHTAPDPRERPVVERIFAAYQKAKQDQAENDPIFRPRGGWKNVVDTAYSHLAEAQATDDIEPFHFFLANFGAWEVPTGIEQSSVFHKTKLSKRKQVHLEKRVMPQLLHWWETYESDGRSIAELAIPRYGNQGGFFVDGELVLPNAVFSDFYARLLAGFIAEERPLIAELGGGYGRLCYFLSRQLPEFRYVAFDLPECLCCASYFLMLAFPEKKFLLYGEGELTPESLREYDFVLRPAFDITVLPDRFVDLFLNENSLGVVAPEACRLYVREICRSSNAFWHRNHEVRRNPFEDGSVSLVNAEYPIPRDEFRQLVRHCDISRVVGHDRSTIKNDMFWYYYQREVSPGTRNPSV